MIAIAEGPPLNLDLDEEERELQYALVYTKENPLVPQGAGVQNHPSARFAVFCG